MTADSPDSNAESESFWKVLVGGWAIAAYVFILLLVAFYAEEDWRGAALWKQAQAEIAAKGESLDPDKFVPPSVPEEENFGVLPIFRMEVDPRYPGYLSAVGMDEAFVHADPDYVQASKEERLDPSYFPYLGNWKKDEAPDVPAIRKQLIALCHRDLRNVQVPPDATPLELCDLLCPVLADLRAANRTHPVCRFDEDYTSQPPFMRSLGVVVSQIRLVKVLNYEEQLALMDGRTDVALADLEVEWKIDSGTRQQPLLIAGLVSAGVEAYNVAAIAQGLTHHQWNDGQLVEIDNNLGKIDYLSESQFCTRAEAADHVPTIDYLKNHRLKIRETFFGYSGMSEEPRDFIFSSVALLPPNGWFDEFKADATRFDLLGVVPMVDPSSRRVFPERKARALRLIKDTKETDFWQNFLTRTFSSNLNSITNFAYAQVHVDEARIACRLERYRLAHGSYPDSLNALAPAYGADLPRDIMNGEPYHYKLLGDGTYLLYSVAWDQIDEGGEQNPTGEKYHDPKGDLDWVWGNHPEAAKTK